MTCDQPGDRLSLLADQTGQPQRVCLPIGANVMDFRVVWLGRVRVWIYLACVGLLLPIAGIPSPVSADDGGPDPQTAAALAGEVAHMQRMQNLFPDPGDSVQPTPWSFQNCR